MRRPTRTHIRRGLAAATITALVTTGATTAVVATAVSSAQAYDRVQAQMDAPPERGSIHDEAARQAANSYREKAQKTRATEERIRSEVVDLALDQIGDTYVAGGEGPNAFDCSGLVVYAYRSVGITLTHYSRAQYKETERVSLKNAVPGDLAFYFENGAAHVAIYIGDGKVVHASDYGIGVTKDKVKGTPWTDAHFTGMGRVEIPDQS